MNLRRSVSVDNRYCKEHALAAVMEFSRVASPAEAVGAREAWIPAFAGMTDQVSGITERVSDMTDQVSAVEVAETVAQAAFAEDIFGVARVAFQLLAQVGDVGSDVLMLAFVLGTPHSFE